MSAFGIVRNHFRLIAVHPTDPVKVSVKCSSREDWIRFVTYWEINDEDVKMATEKIGLVLKEYDFNLKNNLKSVKRPADDDNEEKTVKKINS